MFEIWIPPVRACWVVSKTLCELMSKDASRVAHIIP